MAVRQVRRERGELVERREAHPLEEVPRGAEEAGAGVRVVCLRTGLVLAAEGTGCLRGRPVGLRAGQESVTSAG